MRQGFPQLRPQETRWQAPRHGQRLQRRLAVPQPAAAAAAASASVDAGQRPRSLVAIAAVLRRSRRYRSTDDTAWRGRRGSRLPAGRLATRRRVPASAAAAAAAAAASRLDSFCLLAAVLSWTFAAAESSAGSSPTSVGGGLGPVAVDRGPAAAGTRGAGRGRRLVVGRRRRAAAQLARNGVGRRKTVLSSTCPRP